MPSIHDASVNAHTEGAFTADVNIAVTSGAERLFVAVFVDAATDQNPVATSDQGTLVALAGGEVIASAGNQAIAVFELASPTVATHAISGDWSGGSTTGAVVAVTVTGLNGSTPVADVTTSGGSGTQVTGTVPNVVTGDLVLAFWAVNGNPTVTQDGGETDLENNSSGTSAGTMYGLSIQDGASGGVMSRSWSGAQRSAQVAFRLPTAGGGAPVAVVKLVTNRLRPRVFGPGIAR